ncbi:MAG TPA: hypothetical protein VGB51_03050, partial [Actinomycetota bacterium]
MKPLRGRLAAALFSILVLALVAPSAPATPGERPAASTAPTAKLQMYRTVVDADGLRTLSTAGFDIGGGRPVADGTEVDLVLSPADHARLLSQGFDLELWRNARGLTATRLAA